MGKLMTAALLGLAVLGAAGLTPGSRSHAREPDLQKETAKKEVMYRIQYFEYEKRWDGVNKRWYFVSRSAGSSISDDPGKLNRLGAGWVEVDPKNRWYTGPSVVSR